MGLLMVVEHARSTIVRSSSELTRTPLQRSPPSTPTAESGTSGVVAHISGTDRHLWLHRTRIIVRCGSWLGGSVQKLPIASAVQAAAGKRIVRARSQEQVSPGDFGGGGEWQGGPWILKSQVQGPMLRLFAIRGLGIVARERLHRNRILHSWAVQAARVLPPKRPVPSLLQDPSR